MCIITGYIGDREAMPILIEMMGRAEGWDAAFFTGYATIDGGKLHTEKVVGPLETLLKETGARTAPGKIGFIHSRTPGAKGENFQWSHPFIGKGGRHAYVYNGTMGVFAGQRDQFMHDLHRSLRADGYEFLSEMPDPSGSSMFGDVRLHSSELRSHYSTSLINKGMDAVDALTASIRDIPTEVVTLMLSLDEPDCILYSKSSFPMFMGLTSHGTYLATTPQAFPDDVERIIYLSNMTGGRVYRDHYTAKPFSIPGSTMAAVTPSLWKRVYETCVEMIRQQPRKVPDLGPVIRQIFHEEQPGKLHTVGVVMYSILYELEKSGKIEKIVEPIPGQNEGTTVPRFYAKWVE